MNFKMQIYMNLLGKNGEPAMNVEKIILRFTSPGVLRSWYFSNLTITFCPKSFKI